MEVILPLIVIGLLLLGGVRVVKYLSFQQSCNRAFVKVGKQYNGKAPNGGVKYSFLFSRPNLTFTYRDKFCHLRIRNSRALGSKNVTELRIRLGARLPSFELSTGPLRRFSGNEASLLEDKSMQEHFKLGTDNAPEFARLMTNPVCWQIEQLRRHQGTNQLSVSCRRGELHIKKPGVIVDFQALDDFVRFGLQLYDQMLLARAKGIDFVNDNTAAVIDDVICPICSEEIVQDMVVCTRCKTPHCQDCWHYNGQCATFACGEKRFLQVG